MATNLRLYTWYYIPPHAVDYYIITEGWRWSLVLYWSNAPVAFVMVWTIFFYPQTINNVIFYTKRLKVFILTHVIWYITTHTIWTVVFSFITDTERDRKTLHNIQTECLAAIICVLFHIGYTLPYLKMSGQRHVPLLLCCAKQGLWHTFAGLRVTDHYLCQPTCPKLPTTFTQSS